MKSVVLRLSVLALFVSFFFACPIPRGMKGESQQEQTDSSTIDYMGMTRGEYCFERLKDMKEEYVNRNLMGFMEFVHRDFRRDRSTLRARVQNDMENLEFIRFDMFRDRASTAQRHGDIDVILEFHFTAQYVSRSTGNQTTVEGNATAIWRMGPDDYQLWDVRGDTFFGFSEPGASVRPDLRVELMEANTDLVRVEVTNSGQDTATNVLVRVRNEQDDPIDNQSATQTIPSLAPGETVVRDFGSPVSPDANAVGTAHAEVDPNQQILEENENNNTDQLEYSTIH